jgi:nitroimidazol reductase NimA-like FMN-containing flavoprotein (pyridoxamine 5'-phosphate oxidase superfamily)
MARAGNEADLDGAGNARSEALALLAALHVCTLATCGGGEPHAVSLLYAHSGFRLYWLSDPSSLHSRHIEAAAAGETAAVTIAGDHTDFRTIRGVQMSGSARRLTDPKDIDAATKLLSSRYRFLRQSHPRPAEIAAAVRKAAPYCFSPARITLIDNTEVLGTKITFTPGATDR